MSRVHGCTEQRGGGAISFGVTVSWWRCSIVRLWSQVFGLSSCCVVRAEARWRRATGHLVGSRRTGVDPSGGIHESSDDKAGTWKAPKLRCQDEGNGPTSSPTSTKMKGRQAKKERATWWQNEKKNVCEPTRALFWRHCLLHRLLRKSTLCAQEVGRVRWLVKWANS